MTSRGRGASTLGADWDPMRSEYETSMYETNDEDGSSFGQLDHCRLYVTNIPKALNEDGLRATFANYGTLTEVHLSGNPMKRYGLVKFETPGEAKLAMMKLNHTEPLKMNINIAYKQKGQSNQQGSARKKQPMTKNSERQSYKHHDTSSRDRDFSNDNVSVGSSRQRGRPDMTNGDDENYLRELEDMEELDPDLDLELERLRLQAAQLLYKQRLRDVKVAERRTMASGIGSRCVMADGKIVVRTSAANEDRDHEGESAGAGDSGDKLECLTPPALQPAASRACVHCGARAEAYCARCGVTPYCGPGCQQRDWSRRHSAVCHNLARTPIGKNAAAVVDNTPDVDVPAAAPLRRPRSPVDDSRRNGRDAPSGPAYNRQHGYEKPTQGENKFYNKNYGKPRDNTNSNNSYGNNSNNARQPGRRPPLRHEIQGEEESWPAPAAETTPAVTLPPAVTSLRQPTAKPAQPSAPTIESNAPATTSATKANVAETIRPGLLEPIGFPKKGTAAVEKPLVPAKCLLDLLEVGSSLLLSVDGVAAECASDVTGYVCLSMHEQYQEQYVMLCEDFLQACEEDAQEFKPTPGDTFSICDPADSGWYRARLLSPGKAALLDAARLIDTAGASCKRLQPKYAELPEFCCTLTAAGVKVGDNFKCTIKSRSADGRCAVSVLDAVSEESRGDGELARWRPAVEVAKIPAPAQPAPKDSPVKPSPVKVAAPTSAATAAPPAKPVPEVPRPPLYNNTDVLIVDATAERLVVRAADPTASRLADMVEQDVALYGQTAKPLTEPPTAGQTVVARFTDGIHYRALCRRTNVRADKYLLEYIEYGNSEVSSLDRLYPCPESLDLRARPALTSAAILPGLAAAPPPAIAYLDSLKEQIATLTLPGGEASAPSGSEVILTLTKSRENVNKKLEQLCTPDWKKVQESGKDVISTEVLMLSDVQYLPLPREGCALRLLDCSTLHVGALAAYPAARHDHALLVLGALAQRMTEYCESELGGEPYMPRIEELCIAKFPQDGQWYRAVLCDLPEGPGAKTATVAYLDFGNVCAVEVADLRKMQREFLTDTPALAASLEIRDFPADPSEAALRAARAHLKIDADGSGGEMTAAKCEMTAPGFYTVDAPDLLAAMGL